MTVRRFYAPPDGFGSGSVQLSENETRHLRDVLRLGVDDHVTIFNGEGLEFSGQITRIDKRFADVRIIDEIAPAAPESNLNLTVAAAVLPGDKSDLVVQKLVELGVERLIPLETIRADVKMKDARKRLTRWRRIALEATKQCGRAKLMTIDEPATPREVFRIYAEKTVIFFSERDGQGLPDIQQQQVVAMLGPKGGWDDSELDLACASGAAVVTLGGRILRAETAAIALTGILQNRFGDMH